MKRLATDAGIDPDAVFCDHAGFSTYESLYRAKEIFGAKRVLIVSQKYHLHRALYIARQLGLDAYGVGADVRSYSGQRYRDLRESLARFKDFSHLSSSRSRHISATAYRYRGPAVLPTVDV